MRCGGDGGGDVMVMVMSIAEVRSETAVSSRSTGRNAFRSAES
jgi:hypothetical protein